VLNRKLLTIQISSLWLTVAGWCDLVYDYITIVHIADIRLTPNYSLLLNATLLSHRGEKSREEKTHERKEDRK
jgi:hypothetical protein